MIAAALTATMYLHSLPPVSATFWPECPVCEKYGEHVQGQCAGIQWTRTAATYVDCWAPCKGKGCYPYALFSWTGYDSHPPDDGSIGWKCHEEKTTIEKRQIVWICPKRHLWVEDFPEEDQP